MSSPGLWSRTRQAAFNEIAEVAMDLFLEQGFEATTFDDIAAAAGISRRSLFRYFGTKEDLVLWNMADEGARARAALAERPDDEPLWTSLRTVLITLLQDRAADPERLLKISQMMYGTPSLRARSVEKHLRWQADILPEVKRRLPPADDDTADLRAAAVVAAAMACLDTAGEAWTRRRGAVPLSELLAVAFEAMGHSQPARTDRGRCEPAAG